MFNLRDGAAGGTDFGRAVWPIVVVFTRVAIWTGDDWLRMGWLTTGLTLELAMATGEGAVGINGGDTVGKTADGETVDNGKVIGGTIPGVIVGGLVRSGEDALGTESKNIYKKNVFNLIKMFSIKMYF